MEVQAKVNLGVKDLGVAKEVVTARVKVSFKGRDMVPQWDKVNSRVEDKVLVSSTIKDTV